MFCNEVVLQNVEHEILVSEQLDLEVLLHLGHVNRIFVSIHLFVLSVGWCYNEEFFDVMTAHGFQENAYKILSHLFPAIVHMDCQSYGIGAIFAVLVNHDSLKFKSRCFELLAGNIFIIVVDDIALIILCIPLA